MSIEFLLDTLKEDEKRELRKVIEIIKKKPAKVDKNVVFLRRFTLALMKQYKRKEEPKKILDHHKKMLDDLKIHAPSRSLQVPMPIQTPIPNKIPKEFNLFPEEVTKPIELISEIPKPI